ncbi:peptidyl-alpha-hydroxyglycine alpha-amidating lyase family protein [Qipengyuania marisflavi]|uniref:peptidylamidoglycolate lyase n=1 Tax=Qipengyuania marisflavi TaxID=2486356 RepID=A0A5S3P9Y8_9SPHN|nr:peptidyl-alpha-hydroxyglycine alpha-amidating lyase family protein [Qipengyuania marisflavi]TMM50286.1 6-bladed beta-propeller [Qipengyuania marisflavi]
MMRSGAVMLMLAALAACGSGAEEDVPRAVVDAEWAQIPEGMVFGQVSAVDTDSHGHVFVLQRGTRAWAEPFPTDTIAEPTVLMFARNGRLLDSWGADEFVMPHGLSVDADNRVWITDVAREQVLRFSHNGAPEAAWGERGVSGDDQAHFGRPADVGFVGETVLVADGYTNHRIAAFDVAGTLLGRTGEAGSGARSLAIPHSVAAADGKIYVADRENSRIQTLSPTGDVLASWPTPGHPYAVKPLGAGWVVSLEGRDAADRPGAIIRVWRPDGTVERSFDVSAQDGPTKGHDFAIDSDGSIYVADVDAGRIVKFELAQGGAK